jgi:hypothetical protein
MKQTQYHQLLLHQIWLITFWAQATLENEESSSPWLLLLIIDIFEICVFTMDSHVIVLTSYANLQGTHVGPELMM